MANSSFLTTFARQRDPKLLWPAAAAASVLVHGLALGLVRTLAIQTPALPEGEMAPLPIQLVDPPPDLPPLDPATTDTGAAAEVEEPMVLPPPMDNQTPPAVAAVPTAPDPVPTVLPVVPPVERPLVTPAPRPSPAPAPRPPAVVTPAPPTPPAPVTPPTVNPPPVATPPPVEAPPRGVSPPVGNPPAASETPGQGGQVVPLGLRLDPNGRDIPETPPQLVGNPAIALQPLASSCGVRNLEALLTGMVATSAQMQLRVEPDGRISNVRLLQSTGSSAVDNLVSCVVKQRLQLQPASSAGLPQLTDAYILEARIQF